MWKTRKTKFKKFNRSERDAKIEFLLVDVAIENSHVGARHIKVACDRKEFCAVHQLKVDKILLTNYHVHHVCLVN